jgi:hypothetical protein
MSKSINLTKKPRMYVKELWIMQLQLNFELILASNKDVLVI